jgi:excisionase family DNA binding protein
MTSHDRAGYAETRRALLDKQDAQAALGGISRPTLDRLRRNGEIACVRVGRRVFFLADDLDDYIARNRVPAP